MLSLRITPSAREHILEVGRYTQKQWGLRRRDDYLGQLYATFEELCRFPQLGRERPDLGKNMRSIAMQKHLIFYAPTKREIRILAVLHAHMDPAQHLASH